MSSLTAHLRMGKQALEAVEDFTVLSPVVTRVMGCNPGPYTLGGTNTYLIGSGPRRILFDTGEGKPEYLGNLERAMTAVGCAALQAIVVSHWHFDHLGGVPSVIQRFGADIPVLKYIPEVLEAAYGGEGAKTPYEIWPKERFQAVCHGDVLRTEGATLKLLHTPGHANDHVVAVLEEEGAMFSADNVLGTGTGVFRDFTQYIASLQAMRDCRPGRLYPAHGPVIEEGVERIDEYVAHRMERVRQVEAALAAAEGGRATVEAITRHVYPADLPEQLFAPAMKNTLNVLEYLETLEVVQNDEGAGAERRFRLCGAPRASPM